MTSKLPSGVVMVISRNEKRKTVSTMVARKDAAVAAAKSRHNCTVWMGSSPKDFKDMPPEVAKAIFTEFTGKHPARFESRIRMAERVFDLVLDQKNVRFKQAARKPKAVIGHQVPEDVTVKSKIDRLIELLKHGCTIAQACKALDWERNTVRHSIYGPVKSKGYVVERLPSPFKGVSREYLYKITGRKEQAKNAA